jgi:hypothetical protein
MVDSDTPAALHERAMLHVPASAVRNRSAFAFVQSRFARLRSCGFAPATNVTCFRFTIAFPKEIGPRHPLG